MSRLTSVVGTSLPVRSKVHLALGVRPSAKHDGLATRSGTDTVPAHESSTHVSDSPQAHQIEVMWKPSSAEDPGGDAKAHMHPTMTKEMAGSPIEANRRNHTFLKADTDGGYTPLLRRSVDT